MQNLISSLDSLLLGHSLMQRLQNWKILEREAVVPMANVKMFPLAKCWRLRDDAPRDRTQRLASLIFVSCLLIKGKGRWQYVALD